MRKEKRDDIGSFEGEGKIGKKEEKYEEEEKKW